MALVLPVLALVVAGVMQYGGMILAYQQMHNGIASGAIYVMRGGADTTAIHDVALGAWPNRPADASIAVDQSCTCGGIAAACTSLCPDQSYPQGFTSDQRRRDLRRRCSPASHERDASDQDAVVGASAHTALRGLADRAGATAVELALVIPVLVAIIFGTWALGWALYSGGEVRHAVELGSRIYIANPNATSSDLQTAVQSHLQDVPVNAFTLAAAPQTDGSATNQHITWSYQTTLTIPFVANLPMNFTGAIDVPMATS